MTYGIDRRDFMVVGAGAALLAVGLGSAIAGDNCASTIDIPALSALLDRYVAAANTHDTSSFAEIFTETYLQRSGRGASGLAAHIESARRLYAALPDLHLVVEDRIFANDKIVARCTYTGTQKGTFFGIEPTGKEIKFGTIDIWRVDGGKLAEHWDQVDIAGIQKQLRAA